MTETDSSSDDEEYETDARPKKVFRNEDREKSLFICEMNPNNALMIADSLPASMFADVFQGLPPEALREIADMLDTQTADMDVRKREGEVKDFAYKSALLKQLAWEREDDDPAEVTQ